MIVHRSRFNCSQWLGVLLTLGFVVGAMAEEPLHGRIDQVLEADQPGGQAPLATDADFLRRAYLALHGVIPTAAEARAFFTDAAPDKRARLVDTLLASPQFGKWLAVRLDVMLMERRDEKHVKRAPWREWLEASVVANKPWDELVREMLSYDGADEKTRGIARWVLEREGDPNALAREVGRIFLGRDMGCAQCHDHPRIDDYTQRDYAGLQAFFSRTYLFQPDPAKPGFIGERATGEASYSSVFTKVSGETKPRLPGDAEIAEPAVAPAEMWTVPPNDKDKNIRPIPKFSRRSLLVTALGDGHHPAFRRNIANRLWAVVFGRGLVEPLDLDHSANPPANPALLDLLTESIAGMKFDMKAFIRELALTRAFQRSLDLPEIPAEVAKVAAEKVPILEQTAAALAAAATAAEGESETVQKATLTIQRAAEPLKVEVTKQDTATAEAKKVVDGAMAAQKKAEEALAAKRDAQKALAEAAAKINEAVAKVPEAADLAAAAKTFQAKAEATAGEMPAAEQDATAKKAEADAKAAALAGTQQTAAEAKAKLDEAAKAIAAQQSALEAAMARKQTERTKARHAAQLAAEVKAALAWTAAEAADRPLEDAAAKAEATYAASKQTVDKLAATAAAASAQMAALEAAAASTGEELTKSKEAMTAKGPAAVSLTEAAMKAGEAAAKLPNDADVKNAAAAVKAKADAATAEVATMQKVCADVQTKAEAAAKAVTDCKSTMEKATADLAAVQPQVATLDAEAKAARAKAAETGGPAAEAREALAAAWAKSFAATELAPLMPEQLCWSVMRATGQFEPLRAQSASEVDAKTKLTDAEKTDPAKQAERAAAIEKLFREKLRGHEDQYVRSFGGAAGQPQTDFFATPEQALYFENGGVLRAWASGLASRIAALPEPKAMAEELYLSTLTRLPGDAETAELATTLAAQPVDKKAAVLTDLTWALITSIEFRFSH
jgi:hypothetical protein